MARRETKVLVALSLAVAAYGLLQTMLVPTIGALQQQLHTSATAATWAVLSAPLLASAVLTPLVGRLGDRRGRRQLLIWTLACYLAAIIGALGAWNVGSLIAFRAGQGISMALLPLSFGLARELLPAERLGAGLGWLAGLVGGTAGVGLVCGGLIVDHLSWRWIFLVGAAITGGALILVLRDVPESPQRTDGTLDGAGAVTLAAGLVALLLALTEGPSWGWGSIGVVGLFVAATGILGALGPIERRRTHPFLDLDLLAYGPIRATHLAALLLGVDQFVLYVLLPRLAELPASTGYGFGASVTVAGLVLVPGTALGLVASASMASIERWAGPRIPLALGMALAAAGTALLALWHQHLVEIVGSYAIVSIGWGLAIAALPRLLSNVVPVAQIGSATAINAVARTVGGALGSQIAGALLSSMTTAGGALPAAPSFTIAFWVAAGAAALAIPLARSVVARDAWRATGKVLS